MTKNSSKKKRLKNSSKLHHRYTYLKEAQESIIEEKGQTNKNNSVLRSFARPQVDGKLKNDVEKSNFFKVWQGHKARQSASDAV